MVRDRLSLFQVQDEPRGPVGPLLCQVDPGGQTVPVESDLIGSQKTTCRQKRGVLFPELKRVDVSRWMCRSPTSERDDVQQPPHRLWTDVAEPVLRHHQLCQVERHLSRHRALHLTPPECVLHPTGRSRDQKESFTRPNSCCTLIRAERADSPCDSEWSYCQTLLILPDCAGTTSCPTPHANLWTQGGHTLLNQCRICHSVGPVVLSPII